jgi:crotonobetainyl-CoA:carnitine CoA-transferase CaiB-like acyl-CoA transferase
MTNQTTKPADGGHAAPLQGLHVVDVSRVLAGPYCGQLLADLGADVIKVENLQGDENRGWGTQTEDGMTCNFASVNRGKRSITLNLKSDSAQKVLASLVEKADIVIQSFLPDTARKLGVDYESIRKINPNAIHCSISGYGEKGPLANKPGYDLMMQAFSGVMSTTGYEGGLPVRIGISVIDMSTGLTAFSGIMTALYARQQGLGGASVRVSLLETAISLLGYHAVTWLETGVPPRREGSGVLHLTPYQAFMCKDGYMLAGATNDAAWRRFCLALGAESLLEDPRFATNNDRLEHRALLVPLLEERFSARTVAEWLERFEKNGVAVAPLQTMEQIMTHPQVAANEMVVTAKTSAGRDAKSLGMPFKVSGHSGPSAKAAPQLGEDTRSILQDYLGFDTEQIRRLQEEGAI